MIWLFPSFMHWAPGVVCLGVCSAGGKGPTICAYWLAHGLHARPGSEGESNKNRQVWHNIKRSCSRGSGNKVVSHECQWWLFQECQRSVFFQKAFWLPQWTNFGKDDRAVAPKPEFGHVWTVWCGGWAWTSRSCSMPQEPFALLCVGTCPCY